MKIKFFSILYTVLSISFLIVLSLFKGTGNYSPQKIFKKSTLPTV